MENNQIIYYKQLDSTNIKIAELAKEGAREMTVVVAQKQTAGKGRRGRSWESPSGENIYMSVLLRPEFSTDKAPMITLVMAYCVAKTLQTLGFMDVQIKWPNDLILNGKKICGILTEMKLEGTDVEHVIVGVGINVNAEKFSDELAEKATSLYLESGKKIEKKDLISNLIAKFEAAYHQFAHLQNLSFICEEYNDMLVNSGKEVCVLEPNREYLAKAKGINENGELLVITEEGKEETIFAGEVSVRGVYGYV